MITAAIDIHALLKMVYTSIVASVAVAVIFSAAILGAIRSTEARREHRSIAATAYAAIAGASLLLAAAIVIYGLTLVAHKT
jgi:hypothetical protein